MNSCWLKFDSNSHIEYKAYAACYGVTPSRGHIWAQIRRRYMFHVVIKGAA